MYTEVNGYVYVSECAHVTVNQTSHIVLPVYWLCLLFYSWVQRHMYMYADSRVSAKSIVDEVMVGWFIDYHNYAGVTYIVLPSWLVVGVVVPTLASSTNLLTVIASHSH